MSESHSFSVEILASGSVVGGRYEIRDRIGSGGMGIVYLALDTSSGAKVAVKILHEELSRDRRYVDRFLREARVMSTIDHPAVVRTLDAGSGDGLVYFVMEYVEGVTLESLLRGKAMPVLEAAEIALKILAGMDAIHRCGVIHRDLRPGNILITASGNVKIMDFGVAREQGSRLTKPNQRLGSYHYIAPELWLGKPPTAAVDYYALGLTLYQMITGELPPMGETPGSCMEFHLERNPEPPMKLAADIPQKLNDLVLALLAKSPKRRIQSADTVEKSLRGVKSEPNSGGKEPIAAQQLPEKALSGPVPQEPAPRSEVKLPPGKFRPTLIMSRLADPAGGSIVRSRCTIAIPVPGRAALIFDFKPPSRDFMYFGVFLISLQIFDGILTAVGVGRWGTRVEANPYLREMMLRYGTHEALTMAKAAAVLFVVAGTIAAKRIRLVRDVIKFLSCFYLCAAIVPWLYLLYWR